MEWLLVPVVLLPKAFFWKGLPMIGFTLPKTLEENRAAFSDPASASGWLAAQPRANAPAMLQELVTQLERFNAFALPPRDRFKVLEVLRKTVFAVSGDCQRRFENRPLPLLANERTARDLTVRLWTACAVGYLHCLRACLEQNPRVVDDSARIVHRVLACLRMQQAILYLAGSEPDTAFWSLLHAVWASAEQLGVMHEPQVDALLGETRDSTASGQYCMALLLHLACPAMLSRAQMAAAIRWLARWREQAKILAQTERGGARSVCLPLDLAGDRPIHLGNETAGVSRWLSVGSLLRKMRQRIERLEAGESPENAKLGTGLSMEACILLLNQLTSGLTQPVEDYPEPSGSSPMQRVAVGLENIFRQLGGKGLRDPLATSHPGSKLSADQIAVFDHVVRDDYESVKTEEWQQIGVEAGGCQCLRPGTYGDPRVSLRSPLLFDGTAAQGGGLAVVARIVSRLRGKERKEELFLTAAQFTATPVALVAEVRDRQTGKTSRHPAVLLSSDGSGSSLMLLPSGLSLRASAFRFFDGRSQRVTDVVLEELVERSVDNERWRCRVEAPSASR